MGKGNFIFMHLIIQACMSECKYVFECQYICFFDEAFFKQKSIFFFKLSSDKHFSKTLFHIQNAILQLFFIHFDTQKSDICLKDVTALYNTAKKKIKIVALKSSRQKNPNLYLFIHCTKLQYLPMSKKSTSITLNLGLRYILI